MWKDSARVYFNTSATGAATQSAVKNFPLLIRLQASNFNLAAAAKGGVDLRFTDPDGTELPCHIARWDTGFYRNAEVWVNVPQVDANSATDYVVMWWGNAAAPALTGQLSIKQGPGEVLLGGDVAMAGKFVFDTAYGFAAAWHLDEEAALKGSKSLYRDGNQADNHGDDSVAGLSGAGILGRAQQFDPLTGDYIPIKHTASQAFTGPLSFSAWIKGNKWSGTGVGANTSQVNPIVRKGDANNNPYQFCVAQGRLMLSLDSNDSGGPMSTALLPLGQWLHVAGVWDGKNVQLYVDGKLDLEKAPTRAPVTGKSDFRPLYLGGRPANFTDANTLDLFDGALDEVHMSRTAYSKDWVKLEYENQKQGSSILTFTRIQVAPKDTVPIEDYSGWKYTRKITFNTTITGADVAKAVDGFPVLIRLTSPSFNFSQALADGRDLRFADADGAPLPVSIVNWDPSKGFAEMWTRVPRVDGASKSDFIKLYWGKPDAADLHRSIAVWDTADGWCGVWHLQYASAGKGTTRAYREETAFQNLGDDFVVANPEAGLIGLGQRFGTGTADYVRIPSSPSLQNLSAISFSAWMKADEFETTPGTMNAILRKGELTPNNYWFAVNGGQPMAGLEDGEIGAKYLEAAPMQAKTWYHVAAAWGKDAIMRYYINGKEVGSVPYPRMSGIGKDTRALYIGGRGAVAADSGDQFKGMLDEVQLSRVERSPEFLKLAYESQRPDSKFLEWEGATVPVDTAKPVDTTVVKPKVETSDTVLTAGQSLVHGKIYLISNPLDGDSPVHIRFDPATDRSGRGIADARETIKLEPAQTGKVFPKVVLEANTNLAGGVGLFRILVGSGGDTILQSYGKGIGSWTLTQAGSYFLGRDTVPPSIRFLNEGISEGDSAWITLLPEDNISNLQLTTAHSRGSGAEARIGTSGWISGVPLRIAFECGADVAAELLHLRLGDGFLEVGFPDLTGSWYQMKRRVRAAKAPIALAGDLAWTFAGVPIRLDKSVTLAEASGGAAIYGAIWINDSSKPKKGDWRLLEGSDTLPTEGGIWLASRSPLAMLAIGDGTSTGMGGEAHYHATLVKGWNQVTSPGLEPLPWPIRAADTEAKDKSAVKSLLALDPVTGKYIDADTLKPWQGFFVYAKQDMVLELWPVGAAHKVSSGAGHGAGLALHAVLEPAPGRWSQGAVSRLRLGAAAYARDGIGLEDEPAAPAAGASGSLALGGTAGGLRTDLVGWRGAGEYAWKLAWTNGTGKRPPLARVRVAELALPAGMSLWAVSPLRKMAERVAAGSELEILGDAADTLMFWAAPAGRAFPGGAGFSERPRSRTAVWLRDGSGGRLRIALPEVAGLRAECRDLAGRHLALVERVALAAGYYEFELGARPAAGLRIVTVVFRGGTGPERIILKIAGP